MGLFNESEKREVRRRAPLPVRMRPRTPEEFVGQALGVMLAMALGRVRENQLGSLRSLVGAA